MGAYATGVLRRRAVNHENAERLAQLWGFAVPASAGAGAVLIDIRADSPRLPGDGDAVAGALVIPRNVLEWRAGSRERTPCLPPSQVGDHVVLMCDEGYQLSGVATIPQLGRIRGRSGPTARRWRSCRCPRLPGTGRPGCRSG